MWAPLNELIKKLKLYFSNASIYVQSLVPMKIVDRFTARNVIDFNKLLYRKCINDECFYVDLFNKFLSRNCSDINPFLFDDGVHPNRIGMGIIAKEFKGIINRNKFNPRRF